MSTNFYKYIYGRQNYNRFNRDVALVNECTLKNQEKSIEQQIEEWREWERQYKENQENGFPEPPIPPPLNFEEGVAPPSLEEVDDCKRAYISLKKKASMNPNSNIMSTNMRTSYWLTHQNRVPLMTVWY